ncbi:MAG: VIT and VWA domain-containing protein [Myxococcota bacterium]|nr:VIT and VWA domain-containing protein [Myxococcota bacterium]
MRRNHERRVPSTIRALGALLALLLAPPAGSERVDHPIAGSGALRAIGPDGAPGGDCPLEHTDVRVEITGFVARVRVTQTFSNPFPDPIEAVYTFPLSHRGAVDALWMRTGEREIRGEIHRREEARRRYEAARDRGQVASLLDQERPNVFTQSVANLMPGARVEIEIHYVETLEYEAGAFEFAFPTVVGPRFVPGADRVPDADRIAPPATPQGTRAGHDLAIEVDVDAGVPIEAIESALHEVVVERGRDPERARVRLRRRAEIPNRDFVLRVAVAGDDVRSGWWAHRRDGEDGYATFVLVPPARVEPRDAAPKELVFVVDRSGSQRGLPLAKAKETLLWILEHMNPRDTFQVIDFGSTASRLFERPRRADAASVARARRYIEALRANGGTMMAEAVREAAAEPAAGNRLRIVTFMTDGYVGNDYEVIDLVRRLRGTSRWFPFGTGNSVNRFLLDQMAREGGGEVETALLNRPGEEVARRFWERIASPVLTDVRVELEGLDVHDVFPREPSDVWAGRPLVVHARYREPGRGRVVLTGFRGGEPYREALAVRLPKRERDHDALASLWARAKVDALQRRDLRALQSGQFPEALREEIVEIALAHRLVTPFTSFVAVEDRVVNRDGRPETVAVPVEMPQGVSYEGVFGKEEASRMARRQLANAPMAGLPRARSVTEGRRLRAMPSEAALSLDTATPAPSVAEPEQEPALARLAPALRALLANGAVAAPGVELQDGRVRVRIVTTEATDALIERLEAAGLEVERRGEESVLGWVEIEQLEALARLEGVVRIEVP